MTRKNQILIGISIAVLTGLLVLYFTVFNKNVKRFQWEETYRSQSNQPYGSSIIQKLLASYRPGQTFIINDKKPLSLTLDSLAITSKTDYVFIGNNLYLSDEDLAALMSFISNGNDAFIATNNFPYTVFGSAFYSECGESIHMDVDSAASATMNFYNTSLKTEKGYTYTYRFGTEKMTYYWGSVTPSVFCDSTRSLTPLGFIYPNKPNFVKLAHGKGHLYFHANPLVFTNYFMVEKGKAEYASSVFSHLNGQTILWDEFSKSDFGTRDNSPSYNPLGYILQQESLRYAWWLMLLCAVLYVLFTAKRRQRVIPVLEAKTNTSLEFVQMISVLHFENDNPRDIARKKMKYFFYFIRAKYGIQTQKLTTESLKRLSEKSRMSVADLDDVAKEFAVVDNKTVYRTTELVDLYRALEKIYKTSN